MYGYLLDTFDYLSKHFWEICNVAIHTPSQIINAVNQLLIQIFDVFGAFLVKFEQRLRVLYEMRNE